MARSRPPMQRLKGKSSKRSENFNGDASEMSESGANANNVNVECK